MTEKRLKAFLWSELNNAAMRGAPLVRALDIVSKRIDEIRVLSPLVDALVLSGELAEREIDGERYIGLSREVAIFETEHDELGASPRCAAETKLYRAALKAHPGWALKANNVGGSSWQCEDPKAPQTREGLIDWFEKNHPVEAKQITKKYTTDNFGLEDGEENHGLDWLTGRGRTDEGKVE
jgi:hypothetical protein